MDVNNLTDTEYAKLLKPFFMKHDSEAASHEKHIHVAWLLFNEFDRAKAIYLASVGYRVNQRPDAKIGYHATITIGYMHLVYDCMKQVPEISFQNFRTNNPLLFATNFKALRVYYSDELLWSKLARENFVDGDLKNLPQP